MTSLSLWLVLTSIIWTFLPAVFSTETSSSTATTNEGIPSNCYAEAVYDELIKVIDIVNANTYRGNDAIQAPHWKRFQEDEDYGGLEGLGPLEVPSIVPMIFKLVGSAIALNSSGLTEGSFGFLPPSVSNQITTVLGSLASKILGPNVIPTTTIAPPPRRRRPRTTTTTTEESTSTTDSTTEIPTSEPEAANVSEVKANGTSEDGSKNTTEAPTTTEKVSTTTDVLFKESSLGELPVYAAAYAPNYVATTNFPVYASNFLHVLYPAPTTTTVATTTTASTTSTDPNSYQIALPFDYQEGIGIGTGPAVTNKESLVELNIPPNSTFPPPQQQTPPEYGEYEYEEQTEESKVEKRYRKNEISRSAHFLADITLRARSTEPELEDDVIEYVSSDFNTNR